MKKTRRICPFWLECDVRTLCNHARIHTELTSWCEPFYSERYDNNLSYCFRPFLKSKPCAVIEENDEETNVSG